MQLPDHLAFQGIGSTPGNGEDSLTTHKERLHRGKGCLVSWWVEEDRSFSRFGGTVRDRPAEGSYQEEDGRKHSGLE